MNYYHKGQSEVQLNGEFIGYASSVSINRSTGTGMKIVNIIIDSDTIHKKTGKVISQKENYDEFFQKFSKAFSK